MLQATREGEDPSKNSIEKWKLTPTLQIWAALARRPPQWVTPEREKEFNGYIKQSMRPAKSSIKSDWFIDDNDYYVPEGGRIKPVFNVEVKSTDLAALDNLRKDIKLIMKGNLSSYEIWPRDSGIGPVHIEGETTLHPHFCYVGKVPEYLSQVPPPPPEASAAKSCNVISTIAVDATDGVITFTPVEDARYCELTVGEENSNKTKVFKLPSEALSYPVTTYILGDLKPGTEYDVDVRCKDGQNREIGCTPDKKPLWTPRGSEYPGVATVVQIPSTGETEHKVNLITPTSEASCESYTLTVTASDGSIVETVTTSDMSASLKNLLPGETYKIIVESKCGETIQTSAPVSYTPQPNQDKPIIPPVPSQSPGPSPTTAPSPGLAPSGGPSQSPGPSPTTAPSPDLAPSGGPSQSPGPSPTTAPSPAPGIEILKNITVTGTETCVPVLHVKLSKNKLSSIPKAGHARVSVFCPNQQPYEAGTFILSENVYLPILGLPSQSTECTISVTVFDNSGSQVDKQETKFNTSDSCQGAPMLVNIHYIQNPTQVVVDVRPPRSKCDMDHYIIEARRNDSGTSKVISKVKALDGNAKNIVLPNLEPGQIYDLSVKGVCRNNSITPTSNSVILIPSSSPPPPPLGASQPPPPPPPVPMEPFICSITTAYPLDSSHGTMDFNAPPSQANCQIQVVNSGDNGVVLQYNVTEDQLSRPTTKIALPNLAAGSSYRVDLECRDPRTPGDRVCSDSMLLSMAPDPKTPFLTNIRHKNKTIEGTIKNSCNGIVSVKSKEGKVVSTMPVSNSKFSATVPDQGTYSLEATSNCGGTLVTSTPVQITVVDSSPSPPPPLPPSPPPPSPPPPSHRVLYDDHAI